MFDPISSRAGALAALEGRRAVAPPAGHEAAGGPAPLERPAAFAKVEATAETRQISRALAQSAPVDIGRVAELREAIKAGNYPTRPESIADAMIASLKR